MYTKKLSWWVSFKKWVADLYLVTLGLAFIVAGVIILLLPPLKNAIWQTIGGALLGTGFTILVAAITARQSSLEQYKKDANLQRKTEVYGPLHAELKQLREIFQKAHAGTTPYPRYIEIPGIERPSSLQYAQSTLLCQFVYWPTFKADYRVDNFSPASQKLLDEVESLAATYSEAVEQARKVIQTLLRPHIDASLTKEEQSSKYQGWLGKRTSSTPEYNRWFDFISQQATTSPGFPRGESLSRDWSKEVKWLIGSNAAKAALDIYNNDAINWDASQHSSLSWFQDIFETTLEELKNNQIYQDVQRAQGEFFVKLQEAEALLYQGLRDIRDRYEGGAPLV